MFTLIHTSDEFIVISKKAGVSFHGDDTAMSLDDAIRAQLGITELYALHRLDNLTSGLLVFARTRAAVRELAAQFRLRQIEKFYLAIGGSHPKKKQGLVMGDMKKGRNGTWILAHTHARPAITRFYSTSLQPGLRLYLVRLYTGRTHQIRVALKSVSAPVLGDTQYCKKIPVGIEPDRGYLHSYALAFTLGGVRYKFINPPDEGRYFLSTEFKEALARLGEDPWTLKWPGRMESH
ncbi:MAG: RNA pseudouridine synthase [Spirochaetes bacterium]|nr:MAG: RNA pseudouridine synthase [Spirochaetota bacterium]